MAGISDLFAWQPPEQPQRTSIADYIASQRGQQTIGPAHVPMRDKMERGLVGLLDAVMPKGKAEERASKIMNLVDLAAPINPVAAYDSAYDSGKAYAQGRPWASAGNMGLAALAAGGFGGGLKVTGQELGKGIRALDFSKQGYNVAKIGNTEIGYTVKPNGLAQITTVRTPPELRGQGSARAAMNQVVREADEAGVRLALTADPMDATTSRAGLDRLYGSLGFKPNKGRSQDFSISAGMIREPTPQQGIRAYHGSPHDFERFSLDKIGTGEGAQAYGHGLYFAENEGTARSYRDALTDPDAVPLHFKDKPLDTVWNGEIRERWPDAFKGLSEDDAMEMENLLGGLSQVNNLADVHNVLSNVGPRGRALYHSRVQPGIVKPQLGPGKMYEVNINADPASLLDWDAPLSGQPEQVRQAIDRLAQKIPEGIAKPGPDTSGVDLQSMLMWASEQPGSRGASDALRQAGIPGIKYLDQGSRSAGEGSRNYVIFDDNLIDILRKYSIAGILAGGAGIGLANSQPAEAH